MDDSQLERLVNQCKSNDVDAKVDAVTKLQALFESGVEIKDPDSLISVLRGCLRHQNHLLSNASLHALPPLIPLLVTRTPQHPTSSTSPSASTSSVSTGSVIDAYTLRQILLAFLPPGNGLVDRLGEKEKPKEKAREILVLLGGFAFRCSGSSVLGKSRDKGPETPLMIFERFLREGGFGSKVWRIREQAILILVHIRRIHHLFPIRSYLSLLVDALQDPDGTVRECARGSVVELFTGPAVTDGARADLKREMTKKGVRKTIVDDVLFKVLSGGNGASTPVTLSEAGSENGDQPVPGGTSGYVPPSITLITNKRPGPDVPRNALSKTSSFASARDVSRPASRAAVASPVPGDVGTGPSATGGGGGAEIKPVYEAGFFGKIASSRDLENEFASMLKHFEGKETEHNWSPRELSIVRVRGMLKGEVHERYTETFVAGLKNGFIDASLKALMSLRTTLASHTCSLYSELVLALGAVLDPLCETLYLNLFRMANLTKKIIAQQSQATVTTIILKTTPQPRVVFSLVWNTMQDKAIQTRTYAIGHVKTFLEVHIPSAKHTMEASGSVDTLEKTLKKALGDPSPSVRETARQCFWLFEASWRDRGRVLLESLDPPARKQLEKACPNPERLPSASAPVTPKGKKSSVAAAIAASRAKAKVIATAPPTLRHKATATARTTSPPTRQRAASPSLSSSSSGGLRAPSPITRVSSSSSPPRARVVSAGGTLSRSTSAGFVPTSHSSHSREISRSKSPASPPSPSPDPTNRRRISSPLASSLPLNSSSTFRRAVQTALPASPPPNYAPLHTSPTPRPRLQAAPPIHRESVIMPGVSADEESLLLATNVPIPDDDSSDMDMDESLNLISFSSPYELYPPTNKSPASLSPGSSGSNLVPSNILSIGANSPPTGVLHQPMVEDAMRARAEQAESAAQRLLELVEPEDDGPVTSTLPASLLLGTPEATPKVHRKTTPGGSKDFIGATQLPKTPVNKHAAILRKAALFQDSPAHNGSSTSLFDMMDSKNNQNDWWLKRMQVVDHQRIRKEGDPSDYREELNNLISTLEDGSADVSALNRLALLCKQNPVNEPMSPISPALSDSSIVQVKPPFTLPSLKSDLWLHDKTFQRLLNATLKFLDPSKSSETLENCLIALWEMFENQLPCFEGREGDIFDALLRVRFSGNRLIMQATTMFRDALTSRIEPVYGLTTLHACMRVFKEARPPSFSTEEVKNGSYAFGLIALGKFMLRLPAEVLEDELPRLRMTLTTALTDKTSDSSVVVREAAAASIIAAQLVIQDETHIFALLDGLPDDKKNLLAYLFDKHGTKGTSDVPGSSAFDKLEKEIRRLDNRTSTPPRRP